MPSGDSKTLKVPVSKNMLDSHMKGSLLEKLKTMVAIIIADAELQKVESLSSRQYTVAVRIYPDQSHPNESFLDQHVARTCGTISDDSKSSDTEFLKWNEIFFFKVDSLVGTYLFIFN
ncbi:uncharacterized protein LOC111381459 [Olea europaea var. sylvestris]|uniref:uncharacterized protein LOC111381459 n=1 Tax=Olea europaea var. sylvestris TaxID=158386 RepID=UPI000C1D6121|nr:uncharacterized protein LOC111381459 [Olea europaea var. sylvestris]